ncbi:hypothetical protein F4819DRAFT_488147 [Hypoxylon fuscum]|nr:hypothetical protein F4819DRAFT_488147 [Hypoxylon fuscum]
MSYAKCLRIELQQLPIQGSHCKCSDFNSGRFTGLKTGHPGLPDISEPIWASHPYTAPEYRLRHNITDLVSLAFGNGSDFYKIMVEVNGPSQQRQVEAVAAASESFP